MTSASVQLDLAMVWSELILFRDFVLREKTKFLLLKGLVVAVISGVLFVLFIYFCNWMDVYLFFRNIINK